MAAALWPGTSGTRPSPCRWRPRTPRGSIEGPLPLPGGGSMATVRDMLAKKGSDVITIAPSETVLRAARSEEHTSELQSRPHLVCRLLLEKKKKHKCGQARHHSSTSGRAGARHRFIW